jgi:hypothetical protein
MFMDILNAMVALATHDDSPTADSHYSFLSYHSQEHSLSADFAFDFIEAYAADDRTAMFNTIAAYAKFIAEFFEKGK